jgi:hypothetical protein
MRRRAGVAARSESGSQVRAGIPTSRFFPSSTCRPTRSASGSPDRGEAGGGATDLSGLRAMRSVGGDVTFLNNALSDDQVAAFLHQIGR